MNIYRIFGGPKRRGPPVVETEEEKKLRMAQEISKAFGERPRGRRWPVTIPRPTIEEDEADILELRELAREAADAERKATILAATEAEKLKGAENIRDSLARTQKKHIEAEKAYLEVPEVLGTKAEPTPIQKEVQQRQEQLDQREATIAQKTKELFEREKDFSQRQAAISEKEAELAKKEEDLRQREEAVAQRENEVTTLE